MKIFFAPKDSIRKVFGQKSQHVFPENISIVLKCSYQNQCLESVQRMVTLLLDSFSYNER